MAINRSPKNRAYGIDTALLNVFPAPIVSKRAPTGRDKAPVGTVWCDTVLDDVYILASVRDNSSTWINSGGGGGVFANLTVTDFLTVGGVVTFEDLDPLGVVQTTAGSTLFSSSGNDGELLIGETGGSPVWAELVSGDGSVVIANGAGTIDLTVSGATASTFPTDAGVATPILGATTITGGVNCATTGVGGTVTINVDANPTFAGRIIGQDGITITGDTVLFTSNTNAGQDIYLHANGGVNETIEIYADQGTDPASIFIHSDAGGVTIGSLGLATDDAINITAALGGIDMDSALQFSMISGEAAIDAVRIQASNAAGGIDIDSGTGGIIVDSTGAISLDAAVSSNFTVAGAGIDLTLSSGAGQVIIQAEEAAANALRLLSGVGGLDVDVALQMNLTSSQAAATAVRIFASDVAGGIDIDSGTGGVTVDTTAAISLDSATASNFTVTGAADLTLLSTAGSVVVTGGEAAVDAITITASNGAGGIDMNAGSGGVTVDTTAAISLDSATASNFTVTGAADLTLSSTAGSTNLLAGEAVADAIRIFASNAAGGIDIDAGTTGVAIDSTGSVSLQGAVSSDFTVAGAGIDLTLVSTGGQVIVNGEEAAANAVRILSAAGGLDVDVALQMNLNSTQAAATAVSINASGAGGGIGFTSNTGGFSVGTTGAILMAAQVASEIGTTTNAVDMSVTSVLGSVNVVGGESAVDAVKISASHATGGITLDAGVVPGVRITNGTQTAQILVGTGSPDGAVAGLQGSIYLRVNGGADTSLYVNTNGATAWTALTST